MADFLAKARQRPTESLELLGYNIEVRGLSMREIVEITKVPKGTPAKDNLTLTCELIARCCYDKKTNKPLIGPEQIGEIPDALGPALYNELSDVLNRVNGTPSGNSRATGGDDSSSA
jgi:hypothetical protein